MNSIADVPSERQCHRLIFKLVQGSSDCPRCNSKLLFRRNYAWCRHCRVKHSAKAKCWLKQSNLSYRNIWLLLYCWQNRQHPGATRHLTGLSYPTVRLWWQRFREHLPDSSEVTLDELIEVDESFFGKQKYGHQTIVVGAIERNSRKLRLKVIPDREQDSLEGFLVATCNSSATISTDAHLGYVGLEWYGYTHWQSNHSIGQLSETNQIENTWGVMKRHLRKLYGCVGISWLGLFLKEWEARHNYPDLFYNVTNYLQRCLCSGFFH